MAAAWWWHSPAAALAAGLVVLAVFGGLALVHAWRAHPWLFVRGGLTDGAQYRRQLRIGAKSFGLQIARTMQGTTAVLVIGAFAGPAAVPLYSVPAALAGALFGIFNSWNTSVQAAYGASWAANDRGWVVSAFRRTLDLTLTVGMVAAVGFVVLGPAAVELWTHGVLHPSALMCASVVAVALVQAVSGAVQFCLVGINQHRSIAMIELIHTGVALAGAGLAVAWWGPAAVGIGIVAAYAATAAWLGFHDLARRLGSRDVVPRLGWIGRILLVGAAGFFVGTAFVRLWPPAGSLTEAAVAAAGAVLASATVVAGTILLRIRSTADWLEWAGRARRAPGQIWRGIPQPEPAVAE
jgi:O-antigen/teichoic acid export membrane protein